MQDITKLSATNLKEYLKQVNVEDYPNYIKMLDTSTKKNCTSNKNFVTKKIPSLSRRAKKNS